MSDRFLEQRIIKVSVKLSSEVKRGAFSMIPKANDKFGMETADIPTTKENSHVEITNEDNANTFLPYQGYCSL
jgi:hypothetical protein